jgi:hypothetical protein
VQHQCQNIAALGYLEDVALGSKFIFFKKNENAKFGKKIQFKFGLIFKKKLRTPPKKKNWGKCSVDVSHKWAEGKNSLVACSHSHRSGGLPAPYQQGMLKTRHAIMF